MDTMKFKTLLLSALTCLSISACTSAPKITQIQAGVLQEVKNLEVYQDTTENNARLTKFTDKCVIEFTVKLASGKSVEQWSFKGLTLISGGAVTFARDGSSQATKFDLYDANVQKNFLMLRSYFAKDALAQCD